MEAKANMMPKKKRTATTIAPSTVLRFTDSFDVASGNLTLPASGYISFRIFLVVVRAFPEYSHVF